MGELAPLSGSSLLTPARLSRVCSQACTCSGDSDNRSEPATRAQSGLSCLQLFPANFAGRTGCVRKAVKVLAGCGAVAGGWRRVPEAGL